MDTLALDVFPIGTTGCFVPVESSKLCNPLDVPGDWFIHNYLLVRRGSGLICTAYVGETAGRIERVAEDNTGTKRNEVGLAMLFFHRGSLLGSILRKGLESRLYFALRQERDWHFINSTRGLDWVPGSLRDPAYLELCVDVALEYLSQEGLLENPTAPIGWRPDEENSKWPSCTEAIPISHSPISIPGRNGKLQRAPLQNQIKGRRTTIIGDYGKA